LYCSSGLDHPVSSRAGPCALVCRARLSAPSPLSLPPGPARQCQRATSGSRPAGTWSGRRLSVGARPHDRPRATWHPPRPDPSPLLFPSQPRHRPSSLKSTADPPPVHSLVTDPTPPPPSRAPPPSPPFPRPDRCLRPPEASPSRRIFAERRRYRPPPPLSPL
jgi:hypothetical protein